MKPNHQTIFLSIAELVNYSDPEKWFCCGVVFSPETENQHFPGCPPYITISSVDVRGDDIYFEVPKIVAHYAKIHPGYTMAGLERRIQEGKRLAKQEFKDFLGL